MSRHPDPYTNIISGFIPSEQLTQEWALQHLGAHRLEAFARRLADLVARDYEEQPADTTAIDSERQEGL